MNPHSATALEFESQQRNPIMTAKVMEDGVLVPRHMLPEADEVEIREENGRVIVETKKRLSIWDLGSDPVDDEVTDASVNHDRYIYGPVSDDPALGGASE